MTSLALMLLLFAGPQDSAANQDPKRAAEIQSLEAEIGRLKRLVEIASDEEQKKEPQKRLAVATKRLAAVKDKSRPYIPIIQQFEVGAMGELPNGGETKIERIIDEKTLVVRVSYEKSVNTGGGKFRRFPSSALLLIAGSDTAKLSKGKPYPLPGVYRIPRSKRITIPGTPAETYLVLEPKETNFSP